LKFHNVGVKYIINTEMLPVAANTDIFVIHVIKISLFAAIEF